MILWTSILLIFFLQQPAYTIPVVQLPEVVITANHIYSRQDTMIAKCVCGEARGEPFLGQVMVANVIANRMDNHGKTAREIIQAPGQFDGANYRGPVRSSCLKAVAMVWRQGFRPLPRTVEFFLNPKTSTDEEWLETLRPFLMLTLKNHQFFDKPYPKIV